MSRQEKTREVIKQLKAVKEERGISLQRILDMVLEAGGNISIGTVRRVFEEGSEERNFRYEDSIKPIADVLLNVEGSHGTTSADAAELEALRALVRYKNSYIAELEAGVSNVEAKVQAVKDDAQLKIDFLKDQIDFKEKQMETKDKQLDERADYLRQKDAEKAEAEAVITELKKELTGYKKANKLLIIVTIISLFLAAVLEPLIPLL